MDNDILTDQNYKKWLKEISSRFKSSQIKASVKVNEEMLRFYWLLGHDIVNLRAESKWGSGYLKHISKDLKENIPGVKSFSETNLKYMRYFYEMYPEALGKRPQLVDKTEKNRETEKRPQLVDELDYSVIFKIPWGHHRMIIDKCKDDQKKALFFVKETLENNWSRAVLSRGTLSAERTAN